MLTLKDAGRASYALCKLTLKTAGGASYALCKLTLQERLRAAVITKKKV